MNVTSKYLKATAIPVGDSVTGVLTDFRENKFGSNDIVLTIDNKEVILNVAGNLKFLAEDVANGKRQLNAVTTITRLEDVTMANGFKRTAFSINQGAAQANTAAAPKAAASANSIKEKLAAIRAGNTTAN